MIPKNKIVKINVVQLLLILVSTIYHTHCLVWSIYDTDLEKKLIKSLNNDKC